MNVSIHLKGLIFLSGFFYGQLSYGQDTPNPVLSSIYGTSGAIRTSEAFTRGKFMGDIGVLENLEADTKDRITFCIAIHEHLEVGIRSDIPSKKNAQMNFHFKIRGNDQGNYFGIKKRWIPATAFGINQESAFAVASYRIKRVRFSGGYSFSEGRQGPFSNFTWSPLHFLVLQGEYVQETIGVGVRGIYKGIELSLMHTQPLNTPLELSEYTWLRIGYNWR